VRLLVEVADSTGFVLHAMVVRVSDQRVVHQFTCPLPGLPEGAHALQTLRGIFGEQTEDQRARKEAKRPPEEPARPGEWWRE
jgi:hypothetical protein